MDWATEGAVLAFLLEDSSALELSMLQFLHAYKLEQQNQLDSFFLMSVEWVKCKRLCYSLVIFKGYFDL